jgi:hypothetical protein
MIIATQVSSTLAPDTSQGISGCGTVSLTCTVWQAVKGTHKNRTNNLTARAFTDDVFDVIEFGLLFDNMLCRLGEVFNNGFLVFSLCNIIAPFIGCKK